MRPDSKPYTSPSRFTDPGPLAAMLTPLPDDVAGICAVAAQLTIHHNLCSWHGVAPERIPAMRRVWPPRLHDLLAALREIPPHTLLDTRPPEQRIVGACMLEAHLLAGLLRAKGIPVRVRAGYFRNIRANTEHIVRFWEQNLRAKRVDADLLERDPEQWRTRNHALSSRLNAIDHHIEHWLCECRDPATGRWRLLDANTDFLLAHSGIVVDAYLPAHYFEHAHDAWRGMRASARFEPDQYAEEPQDGRSHLRSQLLWDFYSLLNHDIAGMDDQGGPAWAFVKQRTYAETPDEELQALDALAALLVQDPAPDELREFYWQTPLLHLPAAEADPYSFIHRS